jgi:hypothetical protein
MKLGKNGERLSPDFRRAYHSCMTLKAEIKRVQKVIKIQKKLVHEHRDGRPVIQRSCGAVADSAQGLKRLPQEVGGVKQREKAAETAVIINKIYDAGHPPVENKGMAYSCSDYRRTQLLVYHLECENVASSLTNVSPRKRRALLLMPSAMAQLRTYTPESAVQPARVKRNTPTSLKLR